MDVLGLYDLDATDPAVLDRVRRWLDGSTDPVLDTIDLSDWTERPAEPDWALAQTQALITDLMAASWVIAAEGLLSDLLDLAGVDRTGVSLTAAHTRLHSLCRVATDWIGTVPLTPGGASVTDTVTDALDWADEAGTLPALLDGPVVAVIEAMDAVRANPVLAASFDNLTEVAALAEE